MLQGKIVIVTGGAKGIGRYAAHTIAQASGTVVIVDVDVERLHKTLGELRDLKFEALALPVYVRHVDEVRRMTKRAVGWTGALSLLLAVALCAVVSLRGVSREFRPSMKRASASPDRASSAPCRACECTCRP